MIRRNFIRLSAITGLSAVAAPSLMAARRHQSHTPEKILPPALSLGDRIGLVAPGYALSDQQFQKTLDNLKALGFEPVYTDRIRGQHGYLSNTDEARVADIHQMFEDPNIDGILCARGGYGSTRILDMIDYELIRQHPKVFTGFSDITALTNAITDRTGLITFHGPVGTTLESAYSRQYFEQVLGTPETRQELLPALLSAENKEEDPAYERYVISEGKASGALCGGNLSLLAAMTGTPYEPDYTGKIVFIEEIEEDPYRIDRMLTQLLQSPTFSKCAGLALGIFAGCDTPDNPLSFSLKDVLTDRLGQLNVPAAYGYSIGHIDDNLTLPVGCRATIDTGSWNIVLEESCVSTN
ncbi:S66 peptidase family protein [Robertkochia aurantiaca]|uniref:S66 peptidase family protein n=1 Tax=Robertkochia aurantiaca TaxID=2873700 RepID=UPI001CCBBD0D|nr:LD-carboxypeptidase [Robertkochia sp. 3YJGBD-33]